MMVLLPFILKHVKRAKRGVVRMCHHSLFPQLSFPSSTLFAPPFSANGRSHSDISTGKLYFVEYRIAE